MVAVAQLKNRGKLEHFVLLKWNKMAKKSIPMEIINPTAAGIDVGSRSNHVAIYQNKDDVREFGVYAEDLQNLVDWLLKYRKSIGYAVLTVRIRCEHIHILSKS